MQKGRIVASLGIIVIINKAVKYIDSDRKGSLITKLCDGVEHLADAASKIPKKVEAIKARVNEKIQTTEVPVNNKAQMTVKIPSVKQPSTVKKASSVKSCYLKVKVGDNAPKWEENIRDSLPAKVSAHVVKYMLDMLYDHIDSKDDEINVNALEKRTITISFSIEPDDERMHIKDLDDFRKDLKNNVYSTSECVVLTQVFTHLLGFDDMVI